MNFRAILEILNRKEDFSKSVLTSFIDTGNQAFKALGSHMLDIPESSDHLTKVMRTITEC